MARSKARIWLQSILGVAVIIGGPAILMAVLYSAYKTSAEPGKIDPRALDFPKPGETAAPAPTKTPAVPAQPIAAPAPAQESAPEQPVELNDQCAKTQEEVDQISARLQQPSSKAETDWMHERVRKLQAQLKELKCAR